MHFLTHSLALLLLVTGSPPGTRAPNAQVQAAGETGPASIASATAAVAAALERGDPTAIAQAEAAAARFPNDPEVFLWLGHAYRRGQQPTAATAAYRRAATLLPDHPEVLMGLASLRAGTGDAVGALDLYGRATRVAPEFAPGWRAAGQAEMQLGNHAAAADYFGTYLELVPDDTDVRYLYGIALYFGGRHDDAIVSLEESIRRFPDLVPVRYALGVVLADRPEAHTRALELLQTAASAGFEVTEASYLIGRVFADQGEFEKAVVAFERTLALAPDHLDAHYRLANALVRLGRRDEAAPIMARFAELQQQFNAREARDKQVKTARNELAAALAARDGAAAAAAVDRMYALAADDPDVLVAATKVWMSAGRVAEAFDAAEAASQLDPDHWEANYLYGLLLVREGRAELALAALQRAIDANPLFAGSYVLAGNALMQLGAAESAVGSYLAAIDLEADNPGSWLNLASAYGALGRRDRQREAEAEYQRLVRARDSSAQQ